MAQTLLQAVAVVHEQGIIHRDIKLDNILINEDDSILLADFGSTERTDIATK